MRDVIAHFRQKHEIKKSTLYIVKPTKQLLKSRTWITFTCLSNGLFSGGNAGLVTADSECQLPSMLQATVQEAGG